MVCRCMDLSMVLVWRCMDIIMVGRCMDLSMVLVWRCMDISMLLVERLWIFRLSWLLIPYKPQILCYKHFKIHNNNRIDQVTDNTHSCHMTAGKYYIHCLLGPW